MDSRDQMIEEPFDEDEFDELEAFAEEPCDDVREVSPGKMADRELLMRKWNKYATTGPDPLTRFITTNNLKILRRNL